MARFEVRETSKLRRLFLSNLVCEVVYISCTTYVKYVEIAPIVFELQYAEKVLTGVRVNMRYAVFLAADTLPCVLMPISIVSILTGIDSIATYSVYRYWYKYRPISCYYYSIAINGSREIQQALQNKLHYKAKQG